MALAHWQRTFTDTAGNIQVGISVEVRNESTGALAALYTDSAGGTAKANPLTTDAFGYADFYAAPGRYRITAVALDWRNEELLTFENLAEAVADAEAARDAAQLSAGIYDDTTAGLAATVDGEYFSTPTADVNEYLTLYRNDAGVATEISTYPSLEGVQATDLTSNPVTTSTGTQTLAVALDDRVINFATKAALVASSPEPGVQARTAEYSTGSGGGGDYLCKTAAQATADGDTIDEIGAGFTAANGNVWVLQNIGSPNGIRVEQFGFARNGTHVGNAAAIQAALSAAIAVGCATILFDDYADDFVNCGSNIQLHRGVTLKANASDGGGSFDGGLLGDGSGPIFITGSYTPGGPNTPSLIREITFENMVATNTGGHPICEAFAPNIVVKRGRYHTTDSETFKFRYSFRSSVQGGRHRSTWSVASPDNYTITAYDNCNGFYVTPDTTISGGSNGGGVDITQSQKVNIDGIYETMGNKAVRVAGYTGPERGNCNAVKVSGYFEACEGSLSFGKENRVTGCELGECFISQFASIGSEPAVEVGKVAGFKAGTSVSIFGNGTESAFYFTQGAAGAGSLSAEDVYIEGVQTTGVLADYTIDPALQNSAIAALFNEGSIQIGDSVKTGVSREFISQLITANVGIFPDNTYIPVISTSGIIEKVELLEVSGALTGAVLRIGDTNSVIRNMNLSLDGVTITNGYADITGELALSTLRTAEASTSRVVPGSGTGTFRYKITYRS